jgi:hypothetical protein
MHRSRDTGLAPIDSEMVCENLNEIGLLWAINPWNGSTTQLEQNRSLHIKTTFRQKEKVLHTLALVRWARLSTVNTPLFAFLNNLRLS